MSRENDLYDAIQSRLRGDTTLTDLIGGASQIKRNFLPVNINNKVSSGGAFISISDPLNDSAFMSVDNARFVITAWVNSSKPALLADIHARVRELLDGWDSAIAWVEQFTRENYDLPTPSGTDGLIFSRSDYTTFMARENLG